MLFLFREKTEAEVVNDAQIPFFSQLFHFFSLDVLRMRTTSQRIELERPDRSALESAPILFLAYESFFNQMLRRS